MVVGIMDAHTLERFQHEVLVQCNYALMALGDMERIYNTPPEDDEQRKLQRRRFWYAAHVFLASTANVSKLFWPKPKRKYEIKERGEALRKSLDVDDTSPLSPPRTFRDHWEHFDERLERWAVESVNKNTLDFSFFPMGSIGGLDESDSLRNFDPAAAALTFMGETYQVRPVSAELRRIRDVAAGILGDKVQW